MIESSESRAAATQSHFRRLILSSEVLNLTQLVVVDLHICGIDTSSLISHQHSEWLLHLIRERVLVHHLHLCFAYLYPNSQ